MSNEVYDEFCKATIPNLTPLDRLLLGHYCTRFNESVIPARAWPSEEEKKRITGTHEKSISRSLGRLCKRGLLLRVTLANREAGLKGEYAVNRKLIRSYIQVTDGLPITSKKVTEQVQEGNSGVQEGNSGVQEGNSGVLEMTPTGYPKPIKPIKPIKRKHDLERWEVITSGLSEDAKRLINPAPNTELLLDRLELGGYRRTDIRDVLAKVNFATAYKVGGLFVATLEGLAGVKSTRETSAVAWCGECDRESRQFEEASIINGVLTYACETCSPYAKQLKITRNEAPNNVLSQFFTAFKSIDD